MASTYCPRLDPFSSLNSAESRKGKRLSRAAAALNSGSEYSVPSCSRLSDLIRSAETRCVLRTSMRSMRKRGDSSASAENAIDAMVSRLRINLDTRASNVAVCSGRAPPDDADVRFGRSEGVPSRIEEAGIGVRSSIDGDPRRIARDDRINLRH